MPAITSGAPWEQGFRAAARIAPGWTVIEARGKVQLKVREPGAPIQSVVLPLAWSPANVNPALQLIGRIYKLVATGKQNVRGAVQVVTAVSDTMKPALDWRMVANSLRASLMNGRNEIQPQTWKSNYQPYIEEALRALSSSNPPMDGHGLLQRTLERWKGRASSRGACCIAIRNLTEYAVARHRAPTCWTITPAMVKELRGKTAEKRTKAILCDDELIHLIRGIDRRNPGWANVIRILTLFGLRPIELQHLTPKSDSSGVLQMWCSYRKNCGGQLTAPRWLMPAPLRDQLGNVIEWNITGAMAARVLELPLRSDGQSRVLNGHYVEAFLRRQPEWIALKANCQARGEWLRPYVFRDSYSLRCHRHGIEIGAVAAAMGHSVAVHSSSYRWASQQTTPAAFERAFREP
jgi:integrase